MVTIILLSGTTQLSAKLISHQGPNLVYRVLPRDLAANLSIEVFWAGACAFAGDCEAVAQNQNAEGQEREAGRVLSAVACLPLVRSTYTILRSEIVFA